MRCFRYLFVLLIMTVPAVAQAPAYRAPRLNGRPDLNGIWQAMNTANWDLLDHAAQPGVFWQLGAVGAVPAGLSVVEGGEIPYNAEGLKKKQDNYAKRMTEDPEAKCYMPGVPRATYMPHPFQVIQSTEKIIIAYAPNNASRTISLGQAREAPVDSWMGWSNGKWDGETLVIDSRGFMGGTVGALDEEGAVHVRFLDRAGNYHTDGLHVVERIRRTGPDHLEYEATMEDPNVYTRPWTIRMPLYRRVEPNMQLGDFKCEEFVGDLVYGKYQKK